MWVMCAIAARRKLGRAEMHGEEDSNGFHSGSDVDQKNGRQGSES
jgi:hypothetical protein